MYNVGDRVRYKQVTHRVSLESSVQTIPVHEEPRSGAGCVHQVVRLGGEWRLFVLPDEERLKRDKVVLLLRVPPDEVEREG